MGVPLPIGCVGYKIRSNRPHDRLAVPGIWYLGCLHALFTGLNSHIGFLVGVVVLIMVVVGKFWTMHSLHPLLAD